MRRLFSLFVVAALAATFTSATAQYSMAIRGGLFLPVEDALKDKASQWLAIGLDLHIETRFLDNSNTVLSADFLSHSLGATKGSVFPITVNQFFYSPLDYTRFYFGIGAGATVVDLRGPSKTVFGLKGTVGVEVDQEWFIEAAYFWSDEFEEVTDGRVNGLAVYLGYRF